MSPAFAYIYELTYVNSYRLSHITNSKLKVVSIARNNFDVMNKHNLCAKQSAYQLNENTGGLF